MQENVGNGDLVVGSKRKVGNVQLEARAKGAERV